MKKFIEDWKTQLVFFMLVIFVLNILMWAWLGILASVMFGTFSFCLGAMWKQYRVEVYQE